MLWYDIKKHNFLSIFKILIVKMLKFLINKHINQKVLSTKKILSIFIMLIY